MCSDVLPQPIDLFLSLAELAAGQCRSAGASLDATVPCGGGPGVRLDARACANTFDVFGSLVAAAHGRCPDPALSEMLLALMPGRLPCDEVEVWERRQRAYWPAQRACHTAALAVECLDAFLDSPAAGDSPLTRAVRASLVLVAGFVDGQVIWPSHLADSLLEDFVRGCLEGDEAKVAATPAAAAR
jgi:hypothetical protein